MLDSDLSELVKLLVALEANSLELSVLDIIEPEVTVLEIEELETADPVELSVVDTISLELSVLEVIELGVAVLGIAELDVSGPMELSVLDTISLELSVL